MILSPNLYQIQVLQGFILPVEANNQDNCIFIVHNIGVLEPEIITAFQKSLFYLLSFWGSGVIVTGLCVLVIPTQIFDKILLLKHDNYT